jgi:hypothetical protein
MKIAENVATKARLGPSTRDARNWEGATPATDEM